ncbi:hypothetical protein BJX64DRAFT_282384 [Aspergillus heterothallicus]
MDTTPRQAQASQVCKSCKDRKRKCDKALPKCSLCARKNLRCDYRYTIRSEALAVPTPSSPTASEALAEEGLRIQNQSSSHRTGTSGHNITLPTVLFLDPTLLKNGPLGLRQPETGIDGELIDFLGGSGKIRATAEQYFTNIHPWMPFISKQRFYKNHLFDGPHYQPDVGILFAAIKLITSPPPEDLRWGVYPLVKQHLFWIEGSAPLSLLILQANILIALYELGHGIYPAAYMTIGSCARYMYALGINGTRARNADVNMPRPVSLVEVEERKRVWWAIVILDRFVSIASPSRPFATPDPQLDDLMPSNDEDWDNGFVNGADIHTISTPTPGHMCKFSLLCQAARVLGKVICFLNRSGERNGPRSEGTSMTPALENDERMRLDITLQSMLNAAMDLEVPDLDTITFIYSTMMALYTPHLPTTNNNNNTTQPIDPYTQSTPPTYDSPQIRALEIVTQITEAIASSLLDRQCISGRNPEGMSPWRAYFGYRVLGVHMASLRQARSQGKDRVSVWTTDDRGDPREIDVHRVAMIMRTALKVIGERWKLGDIYLRLLEAQEVLDVGA